MTFALHVSHRSTTAERVLNTRRFSDITQVAVVCNIITLTIAQRTCIGQVMSVGVRFMRRAIRPILAAE